MPQAPQQPRGIHKVGESIAQHNRTMIVTEENASRLDWSRIPYGTIKVNPQSGIMSVKLKGALVTKDGQLLENAYIDGDKVYHNNGKPYYKINYKTGLETKEVWASTDMSYSSETSWVPAGIKNDGTLSIARDTMIITEVFTIKKTSEQSANGEVTVYTNTEGETRRVVKKAGKHVFELEHGEYIPRRSYLEVYIDDVLRRDAKSGGVEEIDTRHFALDEELIPGQEITVRYMRVFRIGNPYPRVFMGCCAPEASENGDLWIEDIEVADIDDNHLGTGEEHLPTIEWSQIVGRPNSLRGYGIIDNVEYKNHAHHVSDIIDFPAALPASGGNSDYVKGHTTGEKSGDIPVLNSAGKLPGYLIDDSFSPKVTNINGLSIGPNPPVPAEQNSLWFDTNERMIKFRQGNDWIAFNGVWK